jgi:hypothetical protein
VGQARGTGKGAVAGPLPDGSQITTLLYTNKKRPNANYAAIVDVLSNVNSNYHALFATITHQFTRNFEFDAHYTWAKSMDFNQYVGTGSSSNNEVDTLNQRADYCLSANDVCDCFVANAVYTLSSASPAGRTLR